MTTLPSTIAGRRAKSALRLLAVGCLAVMLAGCYQSKIAQQEYPDDYRQRHPITLKEGDRTVQIFVGRNRGGLTPSQRAEVLAFAQTWQHEASSGIVVDVPHGTPADRAAADSMREIQSIFAASGLPGRAVFVRKYRPSPSTLASIKISYSKLTAQVDGCGLWPHDLGAVADPTYAENRKYWNLGCATQRNLASMVDNPADLVQPRGESPAYAARRAVATDKYRRGDNPSGTYSGYDKGKISDLGK